MYDELYMPIYNEHLHKPVGNFLAGTKYFNVRICIFSEPLSEQVLGKYRISTVKTTGASYVDPVNSTTVQLFMHYASSSVVREASLAF